MRIVIVEDEIRIREGIKKLLLKLGEEYHVEAEADTGEEGAKLILCTKPDLIITDVKMDQMDGLQMLKTVYDAGIKSKAIVLSAYSEFAYAKTAISLGVTEYLLKPVKVNEFTAAIDSVKKSIEREKEPPQFGDISQLLLGVITGVMIPDKKTESYFEEKYNIGKDTVFGVLTIYMDTWEERSIRAIKARLSDMLLDRPDIKNCVVEDKGNKSVVLILYGYQKNKEIHRKIQHYILQKNSELLKYAIGWIQGKGLETVKDLYETIFHYLNWNISLGDEIIISYPAILEVRTSLCVYPVEIESRMKNDILEGSMTGLRASVGLFIDYFQTGTIYEPDKIKECYVRFFWAMLSFAKEIGVLLHKETDYQFLLNGIMKAVSFTELKKTVYGMLDKIHFEDAKTEVSMHIKRAVAIIHEYYQHGITLDEIALRLGITPEYLGNQFHKELGVNFSTYIRDYRISRAKELLLSTSLKLYEIADRIGYSDPKYFSKVFRDTTGHSPAEFRKKYK